MVLALVLVASLGYQSKLAQPPRLDLPVLMMYWKPGWVSDPPSDQLCVAIWLSGRILWRDPFDPEGQKPKYHFVKGTIHEAIVDADEVSKTLVRLRERNVVKFNGWGPIIPDSANMHEIIRDGKVEIELQMSTLNESFDNGESLSKEKRFRDGWQIWKEVRESMKGLIPKKGRPIQPPTKDQMDAWTKMPRFIIRY